MRHFVGLVAILLVGGSALAGCSSSKDQTDLQVAPVLVAARPAASPQPTASPAGSVVALPGNATGVVTDATTNTLAVVLADPAEILLFSLADPQAAPRVVHLPGQVTDLSLAAAGGPLLAPVRTANEVLRIALPTGATSALPVPGGPTSAAEAGGQLLVAVPSHSAVDVFAGDKLVRAVSGEVTPQQIVGVGNKGVLVDQLQSAVFDVDPATTKIGAGLRAGQGATNATVDEYGRVLVTDTRQGELLLFSADPVVMRQRFPVAGSPYGIAYDRKRDLAWVTLTQLNQVVGYDVAGGEPVEKYRLATVRQPDSVAVDQNSGRVYVASADGGGVQVIQP
ncbi:MAG TPA: hypothetical protein VHV82_17700 [Sporichthyaceae bacterium]|nr:hypothetical protein [Sporichthyaceae bacterium]